MKTKSLKTNVFLLISMFFYGCNIGNNDPKPIIVVPTSFNVEIPNSLSPDYAFGNSRRSISMRMASSDTLFDGGAIYEGIRGYIAVGESGAKIVTEIMKVASALVAFNVTSLNYLGENDKRLKRLTLTQNASYLNVNYSFKMVIIDSLSGKKGLEVFWNNSPIDGIAILSPYYLDRDLENTKNPEALIRVDYSENTSTGYDKQMLVYITGLTTPNDGDVNNLKMFAGLKGNLMDVYGNSNHPSITLFGLGNANYAFRAKTDISQDIAVAQVILPPSTVTSLNTSDISTKYSVKNIISNWGIKEYPALGTVEGLLFLNKYLQNTGAPGFFIKDLGFVSAEVPPTISGFNFTNEIKDLSNLNFYIPNDIKNLSIGFSN